MKMNKKGVTLKALLPATLTIVIVGILLGVGLYTLYEVADGVASESITITNETVRLGTTAVSVATAGDCHAREFTMVSLVNATTNATIPATNYTFSTAGLLTGAAGDDNYNNSDAFIIHTYTGTSAAGTTDACEVIDTSITGTGGFSDWVAVIVVVLAAAVILGIVISSFGKRSSV